MYSRKRRALIFTSFVSGIFFCCTLFIFVWYEFEPNYHVLSSKTETGLRHNPLAPLFDIIVKRWDAIAREADISYSLTFGTYLGWLRNGTYIPHDHDVDVHIGKESLQKLLLLVSNPWCSLNTDLKARPLQNEEVRLLIYAAHQAPMSEWKRARFDCKGRQVLMQIDSCSFNDGPIARLVYLTQNKKWWTQRGVKTRHLDIFLYNHKPDTKHSQSYNVSKKNFASCGRFDLYEPSMFSATLPPVAPCLMNGVNTSCFIKDFGHHFMRCQYGMNYMMPDKYWNEFLKKWVKNGYGFIFEIVSSLYFNTAGYLYLLYLGCSNCKLNMVMTNI